MGRSVLVTGGAGFIGSHVVDALVACGDTVTVIDNLVTGDRANLNARARFYEGDFGALARTVIRREAPDAVIHFAAQINVRRSIDDPGFDATQNIIGSLALLDACREAGVGRFIFASSGGTVYGRPALLPAAETCPFAPISPYGIAKAALEYYLGFYRETFGLDAITLRYSNVYGPRQNPKGEAGVISIFIERLLAGGAPCIWGDGRQTRDFVYVEDVVRANLAALAYAGTQRCFNIGTSLETSVLDLLDVLKTLMPVLSPTFRDFSETLPRSCLDNTLARRELGWSPQVDLAEGMRRTVAWFRAGGGGAPVAG